MGSTINVTANSTSLHVIWRIDRSLKSVHGCGLVAIKSQCPCYSVGKTTPKSCPFDHLPLGTCSTSNTWFVWPTWLSPKRHVNHLGNFCRAHPCDKQPDRQTPMLHVTSVATGCFYTIHVMLSNNINNIKSSATDVIGSLPWQIADLNLNYK